MLFITLTGNSMGLSYSRGNSVSSEEIPVNRLQRRANTSVSVPVKLSGSCPGHILKERLCVEWWYEPIFWHLSYVMIRPIKMTHRTHGKFPQLLEPGTAVTYLISSLSFSLMVGLSHSCGSPLCRTFTVKGEVFHFSLLRITHTIAGLDRLPGL